MTLLLLKLLAACSNPDESVDPGSMEGGLYLNIATIGQSRAGMETLLDNEKMKSLRVVVLHADGKVEHNNIYTVVDSDQYGKRIFLKVKPNEKKKIFLFANEESVEKTDFKPSVESPDTETSLTSFFENYPKETAGFEAAVNELYFAPDYSPEKAIPMSSMYEIEMEEGYVERTFYLVRIATKFTVNFENRRDTDVKLKSFTISSHADRNFLMARVNDSDQNRQLFNGKSWIEWLKEISEASSESDTEAAGWLKDYELPSSADLTKTYESGEITIEASDLSSSTPVNGRRCSTCLRARISRPVRQMVSRNTP